MSTKGYSGDIPRVTSLAVRSVVAKALEGIPDIAVNIEVGESNGEQTLHLKPRAVDAVALFLYFSEPGVDVCIEESPAIEITAPVNINYAPPQRTWTEDLEEIIRAAATGQMLVGSTAVGKVESVSITGSRLGVNSSRQLSVRRAAPWT